CASLSLLHSFPTRRSSDLFLSLSAWLAGSSFTVPHIPPLVFVYFVIFFLMGYFIYATVYAVVGSMVTTTQEGGQLALPIVLLLRSEEPRLNSSHLVISYAV